jgi:hypothetical protein
MNLDIIHDVCSAIILKNLNLWCIQEVLTAMQMLLSFWISLKDTVTSSVFSSNHPLVLLMRVLLLESTHLIWSIPRVFFFLSTIMLCSSSFITIFCN